MTDHAILPTHIGKEEAEPMAQYPPKSPRTASVKQLRARGITRLTVDIPSSFREDVSDGSDSQRKSSSHWRTSEFKLYYAVVAVALLTMTWIPVSLSQPSHKNYSQYQPRLSSGWLFGRDVDNSDAQYSNFRNNVGLLCKVAFGYVVLRSITSRINPSGSSKLVVNFVLSLITILALHGTSAIKIFIILSANYAICSRCKDLPFAPLLTWIFNVGILFANELFDGYRFGAISSVLGFLDAYSGIYPRWHIGFNITMLRLISFNMDYYWAHKDQKNDVEPAQPTEKGRTKLAHPIAEYNFLNYIAYVLYPPLYIAGPIITYNDFLWQHRKPLPIDVKAVAGYLVRFLCCFMTMEFILHYMYVVAIKDARAWIGDSPSEVAMIGFWNLIIVWLKLLIPWRFFRLWALLDGIDPPENMVRCMANNYSAFGFWRSWHRSYNLWVIRYIYIPLGGSKYVIPNTLLVFSFVALWHDLSFRLLAWGWLISLFVVPELLASYLLPYRTYGKLPWYRHACAVGGMCNVWMMATANLIGFVVGLDGVGFLMEQLFGTKDGWIFFVVGSVCVFSAVQLMFEYREEEKRQSIYRRC